MDRIDKPISLRLATDADTEFLCEVYTSTRSDEVAAFGWDAAQAAAFVRMQFTTQHRSYQIQYPAADSSIIIYDERAAGRMIVDRTGHGTVLVDIAVLPAFRGNGIASTLIRQLQEEAALADKPVLLMVDKTNQTALRVYKNLGFNIYGETDFDYEMRWPEPRA